jgi:hypothetical protein
MDYKLAEFTQESLIATESSWNRDLGDSTNIFPGDVWRILKLAQEHSDYSNKHAISLAYGIFDGSNPNADSIVEIIVSKSGKKWIKMLDCFICPSISEKSYNKNTLAIERLVRIYAAAIVGSIALADHHKATLVKVFGRSEALLYILTSVAKEINDSDVDLNVSATIEGRWLIVKPVKKR